MTPHEEWREIKANDPTLAQVLGELRGVFGALILDGIDCGAAKRAPRPPQGRRYVVLPLDALAPGSLDWAKQTENALRKVRIAAVETGDGTYRGAADRKARRLRAGVSIP